MKKVLLLIILSGLVFFLSVSNVSASVPSNFTTDEIASASVTVKNQIETTKTLPNNVNIGNCTVKTAQYLHLAVQATNQINTNNNTPIILQSDIAPGYQEEELNTGSMTKADYLDFARRIDGHMDNNHQAPPYGLIGLGKISYSSQVYLYSRILTIYKNYSSLPPNINLKAWSTQNIPITETQSFSFTPNQIVTTANGLKIIIESSKTLPNTVTIAGVNVNTAQFLHLAVQATNQINNHNNVSIELQNDWIPGNQEEQLNTGSITKTDYLDFAQRINNYMNTNHQAPPYGLIGLGKISYSSQVYLYTRILSVYKTYGNLPLVINLKPWSTTNIPIGYTTFTVAQIATASVDLKTYIETNRNLPNNVVVGGKTINIAQFLYLAVQAADQIKNNNNNTILLEDKTPPSYSEESLNTGNLSLASYVDFAQRIGSYMDTNHQAPPYGLIGLGKISYQNMVYTFSKILSSYHYNKVLPSAVDVRPWDQVLTPVKNNQTAKRFSTIQAAINDVTTLNGDILILGDSIYTENVVVNKKLTIKPESGTNIIINASNPLKPVFTLNYMGNGTRIQNLTITGATNSSGVLIDGSSNCYLVGNNFSANKIGVFLFTSENTVLSKNTFINNTYAGILFENSNNNQIYYNNALDNQQGIRFSNSDKNLIKGNTLQNSATGNGIDFEKSSNNTIRDNVITGNGNGIYIGFGGIMAGGSNNNLIQNNTLNGNLNGITLYNSTNNTIYQNILTNNQCGVYIYSSSSTISFNKIVGNSRYGIYKEGTGMVNATNNWWGTNLPVVSSYYGSALYSPGGSVNSTSWIVMNLTGSIIHVTKNNTSQSEITADLTHDNQGNDTSSSGTIPDGLPVNFTTTIGTIPPITTTRRGKATVTLTSNPLSPATTVSAALDNQTITKIFRKSFNTIQEAINDPLTAPGDEIVVANGTYTENILVNKNLTIISEGNVTVNALNSSKPIFTINKEGSGTLIQGFVISGSVNSYGILLDGSSNCTISNNTLTNNYFGIITNTAKTGNNTIINNNITLNQELGLSTCNSDNCVIYGNIITSNGYGGITLRNSNNNIIHSNHIISNNGHGIFISNLNNTLIQNNLIPENTYGLYVEYCGNCTVYGNLITEGIVGMYVNSSFVDINFNRISGNDGYELISDNGNVNATNNWWGSNSNPANLDEIVFSGCVNYNPWLVLSIDPTSTVNSGGNAGITADLTHNNQGEDTSPMGHVIKGIPISFSTSYGTILSPACTFNGRAVTILKLGTTGSRTVTVYASLDNQTVSKQMIIAPGATTLNITSSALNNSTHQPISLIYNVPLNSSVTWLSILWKNTQMFCGELQIILNGTVVRSSEYVNPAYNTWKNIYRAEVFSAITYTNNYILQYSNNQSTMPSFWNNISSLYNLNSNELQFIQNHRLEFVDNLTVNLAYPGVAGLDITVADPENTTNVMNLNFPGNSIHRTSQITYTNGIFVEPAGYEGVKSFAIVTTQVTDNIVQYWADQKNATYTNGNLLYPAGPLKAAYGTFFTALMMIYCHDILADTAASEFNVTWSRTHPIAVSVGDDAYQTYLTLECDHSMGMTALGSSCKNIILFNSACSSQISTIEYGIMQNLDFSYQYAASMDVMGSVARDMSYAFWSGTDMRLFTENGYILIKLAGRGDLILLYDPETGIMRDINTVNNYYGAYCFPNIQTEFAYDFFGEIKNSASAYRNWAQENVDRGTNIRQIEVYFNPKKLASCVSIQLGGGIALYGILTGGIILTIFGVITDGCGWYANDFEWDWDYWLNEPWIEIKINNKTEFRQTFIDLSPLITIDHKSIYEPLIQ